ncbi:MAG: AAA family ATPase [Eubacteriales bacterium]|nr:AAA family ATPase [Eubacteriales bacterium]
MKKLYMIGGTMGAGKTAVCEALKQALPRSVFLDGDWCWNAHPFQVTNETKAMVMENICFLLNQFLRCSAYENVIFCWVMHEQSIIDAILAGTDRTSCDTKVISLMCRPDTLRQRLENDVRSGVRTRDVIARSMERMPLYDMLQTEKIHTDDISICEIVARIKTL